VARYIKASLRLPLKGRADIQAALDALTVFDREWLARHPGTPPLYRAHVSYVREARPRENWLPVPVVLARGEGDCEDLACWLAAELQLQGVAARAVPYRTRTGWHIVVLLPGGGVEDPSRRLGMLDPPQLQRRRRAIGRAVRRGSASGKR